MSEGFREGQRVGRYELGRLIGAGGFGFVYVARDTELEREVAIKLLRPEHVTNAEVLRRFLQEARAVVRIAHPGIITIFECGEVDGTAFIAMERLHGEALSVRLAREGALDPHTAVAVARQVASALGAAHAAGIVHRDLKPDNVFLVPGPAFGERVKVLDFGIAKLASAPGTGDATQAHQVFGTPRYMSPEQCRSAAGVDHRTDVYALGCILFEMIAGRPPFVGTTAELLGRQMVMPPPRLGELAPHAPPRLAQIVATMLAKRPEDRFAGMAEVEHALASAIEPGAPAVASGAAPVPSAAAEVAPTLAPDAPSLQLPPGAALLPGPGPTSTPPAPVLAPASAPVPGGSAPRASRAGLAVAVVAAAIIVVAVIATIAS